MVYIMCQEREKSNDHQRQSNHHKLSHTTPYGRGHSGASRETTEGQFWPPGDVTYVT
jgi:hypothetical protein